MVDASEPIHGRVGDGASRVYYVAAVLVDGTVRDHPGDLIPLLAAEDLPPMSDTEPRRTVRGF